MAVVQTCALFRLQEAWESHKRSFEDYKLNDILPDYFGRDASLSLPDIHHIHLAHTDELADEWAERYPRISQVYYRTTRVNDPGNDYWLIYAYDDLDDKYLLLTIIGPNAHNDPFWRTHLRSLLIDYVEPWICGQLDDVE